MGIKFDSVTNSWTASYSKRPGPNRAPVSARRINIPTEREAQKIERELILQVARKCEEKVYPYWNEFVTEYLDRKREEGLTESTLYNDEKVLRAYTGMVWERKLITEITRNDFLNLKDQVLSQLADGNKSSVISRIRRVFAYAVDRGHISNNPVPQFRIRKVEKLKKVLTQEQIRLLLNRAKEFDHEWYPHWAFAVYTGMRNGELYALKWEKVDLENKRILVDMSWNNKDLFKSTKSGDDRFVEIAEGLMPVIKELKLKSAGMPFVLPRSTKWDKGEQARELRMFLKGIGLPEIRFHDLRASWATSLLSRGLEPIKVMKMGGWKDMKTMMIYIRKAGVDTRGALDGFVLHEASRESCGVINLPLRSSPS